MSNADGISSESGSGQVRLGHMISNDELRAVIFDLDGTLLRSDVSFAPYREKLGFQGDIIAGILDLPPEEQEEKWKIVARYEDELQRCSRPAPGAIRILNLLHEKGIRTGVITRSTRGHARSLIEKFDLMVDVYLGRGDIAPKPSPDGIHHLLRKFQVSQQNAIMVGDFLWDILAGRNAGILTVLITLPHSLQYADQADVTIDSLEQLCNMFP